jgi:hypothetical protein
MTISKISVGGIYEAEKTRKGPDFHQHEQTFTFSRLWRTV